MDDTDLISRIIAGENFLFRILVERHKDTSLTVAFSILRSKEEAEDVVQDAFLKAFKNLKKFNFRSSFKTWFYRIVVNTSYHALEKKKIRTTVPIEDHIVKIKISDTNAHGEIKANERKQIINSVLSGLKRNESLLLRLYYLGEQSVGEIAEITGFSQSNIKVILHRARKNFYSNLTQLIGEEADELL